MTKTFSDFKSISLHFGNPDADFNFGYTALPNFECTEDSHFENDYFLLYRRTEYAAQVELACSKIYKHILGYGPEMEIVKDGDNFFIASRRIKKFKEGFAHTKGLISLIMVSYFIAQTDTHTDNYGHSIIDDITFFYGIDNAEALHLEALSRPLQLSSIRRLPYIVEEHFIGFDAHKVHVDIVNSKDFQEEKRDIIQKIASIPFEVFEAIIKETITSNYAFHQRDMVKRFKKLGHVDESAPEPQIDDEKYSLSTLITLFKARHEAWCKLALELKDIDFSQDNALADTTEFMHAVNVFQQSEEVSSETDSIASLDGFGFFKPQEAQIEEIVLETSNSFV